MRLKKELGLVDVFCIAAGAMISSGLFVLPSLAYAKAGPGMILSYILAGALVLPTMLSKAELTTAMPKAGGDYFFLTRSMGSAVGTIGGVSSWFSLSFKSAFALVGIGAYMSLITNIPITTIALCCCIFFIIVNLIGVKPAGRFQVIFVLGLLGIISLYILRGLPQIRAERLSPLMPLGFGPILSTAGFVFISYGGLTKVASVAEEVKNPGRNIPLGMIFSLVIVGTLYAAVVLVTIGVLDPQELKRSLTPISDGAHAFMGTFGEALLATAALLAFVSTANAGIMAASRYPIAMSRDGVLPGVLGKVNRGGIPYVSVLLTGGFMISVILLLKLEVLVEVASTLLILLYIFANLAVIIMRESKIQNYQPGFRSPLYPWVQILGMIGGGFLIIEMGSLPLLITGAFLLGGFGWYLLWVRFRVYRESALLHVVERITAKELTSYSLETELKGILRERDQIVEDRFDRLIKRSKILDLEDSLRVEEFFKLASAALAEPLGVREEVLFTLLMEREKESSTVIIPGLAIPHIIIEGDNKFEILLVRCRKGIIFSDDLPPVNAVFVLAGTRDERNFHLRALAAIAKIVQEVHFDKNWLNARNPEELRDIILLSSRKRHL